ncbi:hypothetical protein HYC85_013069 [Camellia sinensis]|uniref:Aldo/keto reductase n=1 Tax=Camellia sinensis TaxID=4442 RepID=A0A7J7HGS6_CAMSI|nr:hypothetical protein HYC85_013069 [Camellia sinensis]
MEKVGRMKLGSQRLEVSARGLGCMSMSNGFYGPGKTRNRYDQTHPPCHPSRYHFPRRHLRRLRPICQ